MKINFKDVTFVIPVRFDSNDRFFNFKHNVSFLRNNFDTNIIVLESDAASNEAAVKSICPDIQYMFVSCPDGVFHRTKYLNQMYEAANTNIVVNYDVDVFLPVNQYVLARDMIIDGCGFCVPYDGRAYDIAREDLHNVIINNIINPEYDGPTINQNYSVGGAFFFDKDAYKLIGWENENFISWGAEDYERMERAVRMGFDVPRLDGPLYHISHPRSSNSSSENPFFKSNSDEFEKILKMTKDELRAYIATWTWIN